jgi:flagellin
MALRINTNIAAMNAHKNMIKTDNSLSDSLGRLSSGLRINKAADDASGMAIADSLRSQSLGLGQAIKNGNDGISIVQTADAALEESINIVNTIKTKSIQSAQDGQTTESRKAIQADISKLRDELDTIAKTTAFNNQKLLSGNFTDKKFQIGAYAGETIDISIQSTEATKIGHITTSDLSFAKEGTAELNIYSNLLDKTFSLAAVDLAYDNDAESGIGAVADAINRLSDQLGISATASVEISTDSSIAEGTTDSSFAINGITIGALDVQDNDSDGALVSAINNKSSEHGVTASVDEEGVLTLSSTDNRAIQVTIDGDTATVLGGTSEMETLGVIEVRQEGTSAISITDANAQEGIAVSTVGGSITVSGAVATTQDSIAADGSVLTDTRLGSGTVIAGSFTLSGAAGVTTGDDNSVVTAGSILVDGTVIGSGTTLEGSFSLSGAVATTANDSLATEGSILKASSLLDGDTVFEGDVSASLSGGTGTVVVSGTGDNAFTRISGGTASVISTEDLTLTADATLGIGTTLEDDSILEAGSYYMADIGINVDTTLTDDMALTTSSVLESGSVLATGSSMSNVYAYGDGTVEGTMTLETGTLLGDGSILTDGSSLGGAVTIVNNITVDSDTDMLLAAGSVLQSGSTLTAGTVLTNDITDDQGTTFKTGTTLTYDIVTETGATTAITKDQIVNGGSILKSGTTLAVNDTSAADGTTSSLSDAESYRLSDVDVTSQEGAQIGIAVADAALKALDKVRSDLGSVQNQLTSTISNISTTQINVSAAESTIRDVDFADESANFTKMQVLSQAGTFAMSQANATSQNVLSLLQ